MRCEEIRSLLSAGLDGELDAGCASRVEVHLRGCTLCAAEREALFVTVRLLRGLPEADPPADLRRRIGVAVLEAQRRSERRCLNTGWLARPQSAGWAWGAALGAVVATVGLISTHGPSPTRPVVAVSTPPSVARPTPSDPSGSPKTRVAKRDVLSSLRSAQKVPAIIPPKPAEEQPQALPKLASVPPPVSIGKTPSGKVTVAKSSDGISQVVRLGPSRVRAERPTREPSLRPSRAAPAVPSRVIPRTVRPESSQGEELAIDRSDPAPPSALDTGEEPRHSVNPSTAGMTQMASGAPPMETPAVVTDDLVELRRRLIDRPLQVPGLGLMKPSHPNHSNSEGWIRF